MCTRVSGQVSSSSWPWGHHHRIVRNSPGRNGVKKPGDQGAWHRKGQSPLHCRPSVIQAPKYWCQGPGRPSSSLPQIASELKDTISSRLRSARNSISVPIASTSDKVLGAALAGCELAWGAAKDTADYAANTRAGRLASGGADLALGGVEKVVEFLLPPAKESSGICRWGLADPPGE